MSLLKKATSGIKWTSTSQVLITGLQFVQLGVLANLLPPKDFGLMAMLRIILGFAMIYSDMGISKALIYKQTFTRKQLSSLFWINIMTGITICLLIFLSRNLIAHLYNEPRLSELIAWIAGIFIITPLGQQFQILMEKDLRFGLIAAIETAATFIGTTVAVVCALRGFGVLAMIWGQIALSTVKALSFFGIGMNEKRPSFLLSIAESKEFISFGFYQLGERTINYFNQRLDQLLIGGLLGSEALGYYSLAYRLVVIPMTRINPVITRVAFPIFAIMQNETDRLRRGYCFTLNALCTINFPILLGLCVTAPLLIPTLFGSGWNESVRLVQVLSIVGMGLAVGNPAGSLLLAKGRADWGFWWNASMLIVQVPAVYMGVRLYGGLGAACSLLAIQVLGFFCGYLLLIRRLIGPCFREYTCSIIPSLVAGGAMSLFVWLIPNYLTGPSRLVVIIVQIIAGICIYTPLIVWLNPKGISKIKQLVTG